MAHPWDHPGDVAGQVAEDTLLLRHLVGALAGIGNLLVDMDARNTTAQENIMAVLDPLAAAVTAVGQAVTDLQGRVAANDAQLGTQISDLQTALATAEANGVDPAQLQGITDAVTAIAATLASIEPAAAPPAPPAQ